MSEIQQDEIDLNLLSTFEALMEDGSIARAAETLHATPSAVSHALTRLRTQFDNPLFERVDGEMQPTAMAVELAGDLVPILRDLRRTLKPKGDFDAATSNRVFRIASHSSPAFIAKMTATILEAAPNVMIEWVQIKRTTQTDLTNGLIDLLHIGGRSHLSDGIQSIEAKPFTFFSFARTAHPAAKAWSVATATKYRCLQVEDEDHHGSKPIEKEQRDLNRPRTLGGKVHDFPLVGPILAATDFIATQPSFVMEEMWKRYDLQVLEPVVAPRNLPQRFAWSSRKTSDPANTWLRDIVIPAHAEYQDEINRKLHEATVPLTD